MTSVLQYSPGQIATIVLNITDTDGYMADAYTGPTIERIILPNLTLSSLYPLAMTKLDDGLYVHYFTLPSGSAAVGSYIVHISWRAPDNPYPERNQIVQVVVTAPFGNYSVSTS